MTKSNVAELTDSFILTMIEDMNAEIQERYMLDSETAEIRELEDIDVSESLLSSIEKLCFDFYVACESHIHAPGAAPYLDDRIQVSNYAGYSLYMTLAGHGTGFWDSCSWAEEPGTAMTAYCENLCKPFCPYIGDDGKIYA